MEHTETLTPAVEHEAPARPRFGLGTVLLFMGLLLVVVVVLLALLRQNQAQPTSGPAPDFTLTMLTGETVRLSDLRGQVVVVNFWASWCAPCRDEAPELQATYEAYRDRDVVFIGVAWSDMEAPAREFLAQYGVTYLNGLDLGTRIADTYGITGVPETFVINRAGNISQFLMVPTTQAQLSAIIDRALAEG